MIKKGSASRIKRFVFAVILIQVILVCVFIQVCVNTQQSLPGNTESVVLTDFHVEIYPEYETTPKRIVVVSGDDRYIFLTQHQQQPLMTRDDAFKKLQQEHILCIKYVNDTDVLFRRSHTISELVGESGTYLTVESFNAYRSSSRIIGLIILALLEAALIAFVAFAIWWNSMYGH